MSTDDRSAPSVSQLAERGLVGSFLLARLVLLTQVALAAVDGLHEAVHRAPYLVALVGVFAVSLPLLTAIVLPRGRWAAPGLVVVDLSVAAALLALMPHLLPQHEVVGTWVNWAPAYVLNALIGVWVVLQRVPGIVAGLAVGVLYVVVGLQDSSAGWGTLLANAATYPGLGMVATAFVHYLRRVASEADRARTEAIEATRLLERERYRIRVHDTTSILAQLASPSTPPAAQESLKRQALQESHRLRAWVDAEETSPSGEPRTLGGVLDQACDGFEDLSLVRNTEMGDEVVMDRATSDALAAAVRTVLHNVRRHAGACQTVLHADCLAGQWEVVVRDDGNGFDPGSTPHGFGLHVQVLESLQRVGAAVEIDSEPGVGTAVTITGETR